MSAMSAMSAMPTVFSFKDPVDFLNFEFRNRQRKNPRFSLRAWSRQLGYENPSYLSHILKRERKLKVEMAHRLSDNLQLKGKERAYFELIVLREASPTEAEKRVFQKMIEKVRPPEAKKLDHFPLEKFELASEWYHWAILEIFYLKDFVPTKEFVYSCFGIKVSRKLLNEALGRLESLGFIRILPDGSFKRASDNALFMQQIPSWAIRAYHKTMLEKAKASIDELPPERRNMRGTMIALNEATYDKAVEILSEAHRKVLALSSDSTGDHVFHVGTHIFPVTQERGDKLQ